MFKSNGPSQGGDLNGFLDAGSHIQGELHFEDTFRIEGRVTGKIDAAGDLVVGENGEVDGEIHVRRAFLSGTVQGRVVAKERIELTATGRITADLESPTITIEEGAFFEGRCSMGKSRDGGHSAEDGGERNVTKMPVAGKG